MPAPIDEYVKARKLDLSQLHPAALETCKYRSKLYGIPIGADGMFHYGNVAKIREAGLDSTKPPQLWDEWLDWSLKLTKKDPNGEITQLGAPIPGGWPRYNVVWSFGGQFFDASGTEATPDDAGVVGALEFLRSYAVAVDIDAVGRYSKALGGSTTPQNAFIRCARWGTVEYHARLNHQLASYIKSRWPGRLVSANTWPTSIEDPDDLQHVIEMARGSDVVVDVFSMASRRDPGYRAQLVRALAETGAAYGTNGGICVRPPQHWQHLRWFIPILRVVSEHTVQLYRDGGRAAGIFCRAPDNPGDEVSFRVHCRLPCEPDRPLEPLVTEVVEELHEPRSAPGRDALVALFRHAGGAFLDRWQPPRAGAPIDLERLAADRPGEPTYLTQHRAPEDLVAYEQALEALRDDADRLMAEVRNQERMRRVGYSIDGALGDVAHALRLAAGPGHPR